MNWLKYQLVKWVWPQLWPNVEKNVRAEVERLCRSDRQELNAYMAEHRESMRRSHREEKDAKELKLRHHEDILKALEALTEAIKSTNGQEIVKTVSEV